MSHRGNAPKNVTRRQFLQLAGATVGSAAVMHTMSAWGLMEASAQIDPPQLEGDPAGASVIVVGAGPGGCVAAYELMERGYDVTVLEAQSHIGGHILTVRNGTVIQEFGGEEQVCTWDEGLWFEAGPSRVPSHHRAFHHYGKLFNIPMADYNIINDQALMYAEGIDGPLDGQALRLNRVRADMAGYTSELLAKVTDAGLLDEEVTAADQEMLLGYLTSWGLLSASDLEYHGSNRGGYEVLPGVGEAGVPNEPYAFEELLPFASAIVRAQAGYLSSVPTHTWQSTMVYPRNGMDTYFEDGFGAALGDRLRLNSPVQEIRQSEEGVRVVYEDPDTGESAELTADYCVCNAPLSVLLKMGVDFSSDMRTAVSNVPYAMAVRMGLAFERRFWEEDDWIYGGQSFFNVPEINIIHYPDVGYHDEKGVLLGMYNFGAVAARVSGLSMSERTELALEYGSKLHPTYRDDFHSAISVAWHRMPYSLGAWPDFTPTARAQYYPRLLEPDGRIYLVGEHLSYVNGWLEGAFQAAWYQVEQLHGRVMQSA